MHIQLVDNTPRHRFRGYCTPYEVEVLTGDPTSPAYDEVLRLIRNREAHIRCACPRVLHPVDGKKRLFLRRNPSQPVETETECVVCRTQQVWYRAGEDLPAPRLTEMGLILGSQVHTGEPGTGSRMRGRGGGTGPSYRNARAQAVLRHFMAGAGFTSLRGPLTAPVLWRMLLDQVVRVVPRAWKGHADPTLTMADFCWMPGGEFRGGFRDLNNRLIDRWPQCDHMPEGWVFGFIDVKPVGVAGVCQVRLHVLDTGLREAREKNEDVVYRGYRLTVPSENVHATGATGPYIAFAVGTPDRETDRQYAVPLFHRLILHSIAGELTPIPVESRHERDVVLLLLSLGIAFEKPVFDDEDGLRPDVLLREHRIIIEVQGMNKPEYRRHKVEIQRRLLESPLYRDYRLVTYDRNDGEKLEAFKAKLLQEISLSY